MKAMQNKEQQQISDEELCKKKIKLLAETLDKKSVELERCQSLEDINMQNVKWLQQMKVKEEEFEKLKEAFKMIEQEKNQCSKEIWMLNCKVNVHKKS